MNNPKPVAEQTFWEHEGDFLWDYLEFGTELRHFASHHFREAARDENPIAQRMALLCVFREMMTGFEDLGALLVALRRRHCADPACRFQKTFGRDSTPLMYTLINYRDIGLAKILPSADATAVYAHFGFSHLIPSPGDRSGFLTTDVAHRGLQVLARFVSVDCLQAETQSMRPQAYNKIKHGGVVLSDGAIFFPRHPPGPAVVDRTTTSDPLHPLSVLTLPLSEERIDQMHRSVWLTTTVRKILVALYLWKEHQAFLRRKDIAHPALLFTADMRNLLEYQDPQRARA